MSWAAKRERKARAIINDLKNRAFCFRAGEGFYLCVVAPYRFKKNLVIVRGREPSVNMCRGFRSICRCVKLFTGHYISVKLKREIQSQLEKG